MQPEASILIDPVTLAWCQTPGDHAAAKAGCWFDLAAAERVRAFFAKFLRHATGKKFAGKSFILLEWQWKKIVGPLFGWKRPDGTRRFRNLFGFVPKKNGKSTLLAAILLALLVADGEPAAELYICATTREQATICFREAAKFVGASPALKTIVEVKEHTRTLIYRKAASFLRVLSADADSAEGVNAHAVCIDELHAHRNRKLFDALAYSGSARTQPCSLVISTAGDAIESLCGEQYTLAKKVLEGELEQDDLLVCIYEAGPEDDWTDPATWERANPSLGETIDRDTLARECAAAKLSPAREAAFCRYRLNRWGGKAESAWLSLDKWDKNKVEGETLDGMACYGGLDLGAVSDLTAYVLLFPHADGTISIRLWCWVPRAAVDERESRGDFTLTSLHRAGVLEVTEGDVADFQFIRKRISEISQAYRVQQIAIDRLFDSYSFSNDLISDGFDVVPVGQGWRSQSLPMKELERHVLGGTIRHDGNRAMRWMIGNTVATVDVNENLSLNKRSAKDKVDGVAALVMSLGLHLNAIGSQGGSDVGFVVI